MALRPLGPGSVIRFVSPASSIEAGKVERAREILESWDFVVEYGVHAFDSDFYLAGSDADRASDLMHAFRDDSVDAVFCTRGGYGCARLFPFLNIEEIANSGKLFLGYSDITTLHLALNNRGVPSLYAPMPLTFQTARDEWVYDSLRAAMMGENPLPKEAPAGVTVVSGWAEGTVVGGCLCLLTDSIATPNALQTDGKIVVIEDVDENPHRVDAMLTHLINSGLLPSAAGIVVGEMTRTDEIADQTIGAKPWRDIVIERLAPLGKPMIIDYPFGHAKNMLTLPLGVKAVLNADSGRLDYKESVFR